MDVTQLYSDGGLFMGPILVCGVGSAVAGLVALLVHRNSTGIVAIVFSVLCFALGYAGFYAGMLSMMKQFQHAGSADFAAAMTATQEKLNIPLYFGSFCSAPGLLGGLVALLSVRRKKARMALQPRSDR